MPVDLMYRQDWGAAPPNFEEKQLEQPAKYVICASTRKHRMFGMQASKGELKRLQSHHLTIPDCSDIRYNFVISCDGVVYEGRGWDLQPFLPYMFRRLASRSIFIALTGNFADKKYRDIPPRMLPALHELIQVGVYWKKIDPEYETHDL